MILGPGDKGAVFWAHGADAGRGEAVGVVRLPGWLWRQCMRQHSSTGSSGVAADGSCNSGPVHRAEVADSFDLPRLCRQG